MFIWPSAELMGDRSFCIIAEDLGITKDLMKTRYKLWCYVWAMWVANIKKGMRILDFGPGSAGWMLGFAAKRGAVIHAIDLKRFPKGLKGDFRKENIINTSFPNNHFDMIISVSVIEHIHPRLLPKVFKVCNRLLKVGGKLILTTVADQKVGYGVNDALKGGKIFFVPVEYMLEAKPGFKLIKCGESLEHPGWDNDSIIWARYGGINKNKQWTEYGAVFERVD